MTTEQVGILEDAASAFLRKHRARPFGAHSLIGSIYLELSLYAYRDDLGYKIGAIANIGSQHGRGKASKVLRSIIALADECHCPLYLIPKPFGKHQRLDLAALVAWYERHGFEKVGEVQSRMGDESVVMEPLYKRPAH